MIELKGKYTTAKVFTDNIDQETISQIINLCNQDFAKESKIRIMPDTHAGKGCVIGFTADLGDKVIPNLIGVDIGCGMLTIELGKIKPDLQALDNVIRKYIPSGRDLHEGRILKFPGYKIYIVLENLKIQKELKKALVLLEEVITLSN